MSRRRRHTLKSAARARSTWDKTLRRRARGARSAGAASATAVAAVTLASVTTAFATPSIQDATRAAQSADVVSAECPSPRAPSSAPRALAVLGDTLFFTASDGIHGRELWKSDGTEDGTVLVKNINPNDTSQRRSSNPSYLTAVEGTLFFSATDGTRGRELWRSDGTTAGTVQVKNIHPSASGDPGEITPVGRGFYFTADDGTHGEELWKSDGSRAGTVLVKDISPRWAQNYYGSPHYLTALGSRVFFAANGGQGVELWRSNGTRTGTVMVRNIDTNERNDAPDYPGAMPSRLTTIGGRLYFVAVDDVHGEELWKSDGSRASTVLVKDIDPRDRRSGSPTELARFGDRLFFSARDATHGRELWRSDGSAAGTVMVKNIEPGDSTGYASGGRPSNLTPVGERLFFVADDGTTGEGLWKSDGTRAGTVLVKNLDFRPGEFGYPAGMTAANDQLFFTAETDTPGLGLWTSDGSPEGTVVVKDFDSCDDSYYPTESRPSYLTPLGGRLFFAAEDAAHGEELWVSDGTPDGTVLVKDIRRATP